MDAIELAALPANTPLVAALATMRAKQQSAVVRVDGEKLALAIAPAVVRGIHLRQELLSDLQKLPEISTEFVSLTKGAGPHSRNWITTAAIATRAGNDPWSSVGGSDSVQQHFDREGEHGNRYVVASLSLGRAVIITAHEGLARELGATPDRPYCSCSDTFHDFPLRSGELCPEHNCAIILAGQ